MRVRIWVDLIYIDEINNEKKKERNKKRELELKMIKYELAHKQVENKSQKIKIKV